MAQTTSSPNKSSSGATSMAELMAKKQQTFKTFHKSDLVEGKITKLTSGIILVDIQAKSEAVVLEKDRRLLRNLLSTLHVGDTVTVSILNAESDSGNPVVSLRRFMEDAAWVILEKLKKSQEQISVTVTDVTKAGYVASTSFGVSGFLPQSHVATSTQQVQPGSTLKIFILELDRKENKAIFSQRSTMPVEEFEKIAKQFNPKQKVTTTVANITNFGVFVTIALNEEQSLDGLIHISEISWEKVLDISDLFTQGQKIEAVVIGVDKEARRLDLSIKRLTEDPFEKIAKNFPVDKKATGIVTDIVSGNVHVDLGDGIEGVIRKEKVPPTVSYTIGTSVTVTVSEVDTKRHRLLLTPVLLEKPIGYR